MPASEPNPINDIEDKKSWMDFGRQAYFIYQGALEEGASEADAMKMTVAFYAGMFRGVLPPSDPEQQ